MITACTSAFITTLSTPSSKLGTVTASYTNGSSGRRSCRSSTRPWRTCSGVGSSQTIIPFRLSFLSYLPCTRGTTIGAGDDRLGDAVGYSGETGIVAPAQCILQRTHHYFPRISAESLDHAERREESLHGREGFLRRRAGGRLGNEGLGRMSQILVAQSASGSSTK